MKNEENDLGSGGNTEVPSEGHGGVVQLSSPYDQSEDTAIVNAITAVVREADRVFERVGGSSRHWARDCFLPLLNQAGFALMRVANASHAQRLAAADDLYEALFEIREACCSGMGALPPDDIERGQKALEKASSRGEG